MRRRTVLAGVAVVAALGGAGTVQAAPSTVGLADVVPTFSGAVPVETLTAYGERGMHVVDYQHGAQVGVALELRNTGPLPLTVTSVALPAAVAPLLDLRVDGGLPLSLLPGERGTVRGTAVLDNCRYTHERQVELHERLEVGFSVLGSEGVREVRLDRPVMVHSPMVVGCPDRKLDRQAHDRSDLVSAG